MSDLLCPHCQKEFPEEVLGGRPSGVCPHCGQRVQASEAVTMQVPLAEEGPPPADDTKTFDDRKKTKKKASEGDAAEATYSLQTSEVTEMLEEQAPVSEDSSLILERDILNDRHDSAGGRKRPAGRSRPGTGDRPAGSDTDGRDPLVGQLVGGCEILAPLGRGAMGAVYRARQVSVDRIVAVKTIREDFCADEHFLNRFQQEARTVGRFNTPYVVQIHEIGCDGDIHFIIMEFVPGGNLNDHVQRSKEKRLSAEDAIRFLRQAAEGLLAAEELDIVHRDIKPENLLLDQNGNIKIADFGIAKILGATIQMTNSPAILGTPLYMSPEQAQGKDLDRRSDMYSLGATFYHMLTGTPPVKGDSVYDLLQRKVEIDFLSPDQILQDDSVPEYLSRVIEKMTALYPEYRYESFAELVEDLDLIIAGHEPLATTPKIKRKKKVWRKVAAVFLVLVLGVVAAAFVFDRNNPEQFKRWFGFSMFHIVSGENAGNGSTTFVAGPKTEAPAKIGDLRSNFNLLKLRLDDQPDFQLADDAEATKESAESELDRIKSDDYIESVENDVEALITDLDEFIKVAKQAPIDHFETRIADLKSQLRDVSSRSTNIKVEAEALLKRIPYPDPDNTAPQGEKWRAELTQIATDFAAIQTIERTLETNDALAPQEGTSNPPYKNVLNYWQKIDGIQAPGDCGPELHEWLANEKDRRRRAITELARTDFEARAKEIRKARGQFEAREMSVDPFRASVAMLRQSRANLEQISGSPEPWESILPVKELDAFDELIAGRSSVNQEIARLEEKAREILGRFEQASAIAEWRKVRADSIDELKTLDMAIEKIASTEGIAAADAQSPVRAATETRARITALDTKWNEHAALYAKVVDHLAGRRLTSDAARQDLEALRQSPLADVDKASDGLVGAWASIEAGLDAVLVDLDLSGAKRSFGRAGTTLEELGADDPNAATAAAYPASLLQRVEELGALTSGKMAPVRGGTVKLPEGEQVAVSGFFLDRFEVTVEEFKEFVAELQNASYAAVKDHWPDERTFTISRSLPRYLTAGGLRNAVLDSWPIEQVTYHQALAYLRSVHPAKDLFTYAEWWLAARGSTVRTKGEYPCPYGEIVKSGDPRPADQGAVVTGFSEPGRTVHHLAGNVAEWCKHEGDRDRTRLIGGSYKERRQSMKKRFSGEDPQWSDLDKTNRGFGFRGVIRPGEFFADLLPR